MHICMPTRAQGAALGVSECPRVAVVPTALMLGGHSPPRSGSSTAEPPGTPDKGRESKFHPRRGAGPHRARLLPAFSILPCLLSHPTGSRGVGSGRAVRWTITFVLCPWWLRGAWDTVLSQKSAELHQSIPGSPGVILGWDRKGTWGFSLPTSPTLYLVGAEDQLEVQPDVHTDVLGEERKHHVMNPKERDEQQRGLCQPPVEGERWREPGDRRWSCCPVRQALPESLALTLKRFPMKAGLGDSKYDPCAPPGKGP